MDGSQYTVEGALAKCAFNCDDSKNCFFADLEHNHNYFVCHLLGDCEKTRSTSISIFSENGLAYAHYKKEQEYKGEWALLIFCASASIQVGYISYNDHHMTWGEALERCAIKCDKNKNCFFANFDNNGFKCTLLKDCPITNSQSISTNSETWRAFYKKA